MEWLRHGALLLGKGSADRSESLDDDSNEELKVVQRILVESQRSRDGVRSSSESRVTHAAS